MKQDLDKVEKVDRCRRNGAMNPALVARSLEAKLPAAVDQDQDSAQLA